MKILIQQNDNNLAWVDTVYSEGQFRTPDKRRYYGNSVIYAVKDDDRSNTVICSACGAEVPNTPEALQAHRDKVNRTDKCFECRNLRPQDSETLSNEYVDNGDGTFMQTTKRKTHLICNNTWAGYQINTDAANGVCMYARCASATYKNIEDFWTKNPEAFDEFITVDRIIEVGYKNMRRYDHVTQFELKGRARLVALVNNQGICYAFELHYRRSYYIIRYSKKYDKVWWTEIDQFMELNRLDVSNDIQAVVLNKMRTLYN